ncbi:MAG: aminotransferase class IV [Peptostreptococcaceae bacterium]|nr:aminotransferase class IV [Peptostreptococcaceae bacterium]
MPIKDQTGLSWDADIVRYGKGLFETMLCRDGGLNFLEEHLERMRDSSEKLGIGFDYLEQAKEDIRRKKNDFQENSVVRLTLCDEGWHIAVRENPYRKEQYRAGLSLCLSPYRRGESPLYEHKTTCYLENLLAMREAARRGFDASIWEDMEGNLLEAAHANIFFEREGRYFFPSEKNFLVGIMLKNIKRILKLSGYNIEQRKISVCEISGFTGAFLCNSVMGVMPVRRIEDIHFTVQQEISDRMNVLIREVGRGSQSTY